MPADLLSLQRRLRVRFQRPELLALALVHRSYLNEADAPNIGSNERLEFLGDAVLGLVVASWLYARYPDVNEGRLTELRAAIVKSETLGRVAERLKLGPYLVLGRGEEGTGGRTRPLNLARAFESVIGAVFLDRGFLKSERWLLRMLAPELEALGGGDLPADAKTELQHQAQSLYGSTPRYRVVRIDGPDHDKRFTVEVVVGLESIGAGTGRSKRLAERLAAESALTFIRLAHPEAFAAG